MARNALMDFYGYGDYSPANSLYKKMKPQYDAEMNGEDFGGDGYGTYAPKNSLLDNLPRLYGNQPYSGQAPENTMVNNRTGQSYKFNSGQQQQQQKNDPNLSLKALGHLATVDFSPELKMLAGIVPPEEQAMIKGMIDYDQSSRTAAAARYKMASEAPLRDEELRSARLQNQQREQELKYGKVPQGYRVKADGTGVEPIPGGPGQIGKALPIAGATAMASAGAAVENSERLAKGFRDEYGGHTILGDMSNLYKRNFGDDTGQSQWWQDMDSIQNQTRHELFGSALTATELQAWEKTSITPRMNPTQIRQNLMRRSEIEARAASKIARAAVAAGYNKDQIKELLGSASRYIDSPAPPVGQGNAPIPTSTAPKNAKGWLLHVDGNGNRAYVGPNGEIEEVR